MEAFDRELRALQQQTARRKKITAMIGDLDAQRQALVLKERELRRIKASEQADVDALEGHTLAALFYAISGKKQEKLEQEQAEARAAAVKYETAVFQLQETVRSIGELNQEWESLAGCEERYLHMLDEKKARIKAAGLPGAEELCRLEEERGMVENQQKELGEALSAGRRALDQMDDIREDMNDAEGWGTWDLIGGGLMATAAKHARLDAAQRKLERLQCLLAGFRTELADVQIGADLQIQADGFLTFADYFFDGLLADWAVLNHIQNTQARLAETAARIGQVMTRLDEMQRGLCVRARALNEKIETLTLES